MFLFEKSIGLLPEAYLPFDPLVDDATKTVKDSNNLIIFK